MTALAQTALINYISVISTLVNHVPSQDMITALMSKIAGPLSHFYNSSAKHTMLGSHSNHTWLKVIKSPKKDIA